MTSAQIQKEQERSPRPAIRLATRSCGPVGRAWASIRGYDRPRWYPRAVRRAAPHADAGYLRPTVGFLAAASNLLSTSP